MGRNLKKLSGEACRWLLGENTKYKGPQMGVNTKYKGSQMGVSWHELEQQAARWLEPRKWGVAGNGLRNKVRDKARDLSSKVCRPWIRFGV